MPNPLYAADLRLRVRGALAAAANAADIHHPGLKGAVREILVRELLRPILPPTIAIGTGKIVDHVGNQSDEIDIILYDRAILPPLLYGVDGTTGVFPVEACLYAIQVKSRSTMAEFRKVVKQGESLNSLVYLREVCGPHGNPVWRVTPAYFAFKSNLRAPRDDDTEPPEISRWRGVYDQNTLQWSDTRIGNVWTSVPHPPVRVLCVAGQGYGYYDGSRYLTYKADGNYSEVGEFILGVANTLLDFATRRFALPFGYYLAGEPQAVNEPEIGSEQEIQNVLEAVRRLAEQQTEFDANEAARAALDDATLRRGFRLNEPVMNIGSVNEAIDRLIQQGLLQAFDSTGEGQPARWSYVAPAPQ